MHYVVIVMGIMIGLLFWQYTEQVEAKVEAQVTARVNAASLELKNEISRINAAHNEEVAGLKADAQRNENAHISENNVLRLNAERRAEESPLDFGDDIALDLYRISCRVQSGSDHNQRAACDNLVPEADTPALTLTVTPELAERWEELCDDGREDFCRWSITGFIPQGAYNILSWLEQVDRYALQQAEHIDSLHSLINTLQEKADDGED